MKGILKWPLILAAVVVVLRVIVEQSGAPDSVSNVISVVALHLVIVPLYFAIRIGRSAISNPYLTQLKLVVLYVVIARAMVLPTYWLARIYDWPQPRFFGLSDATPFNGYITIPVGTAVVWIVFSTIFGTALGWIVIAIIRRSASKPVSPAGVVS
jgi:glycopeptide antibiotics resistance protein